MDKTEAKLKKEIEKWTKILEEKLEKIEINNGKEEVLKNIKAYYSDSKYFLSQKDYIRAFEALIWSFSWLEIGLNYKFLINKRENNLKQKIKYNRGIKILDKKLISWAQIILGALIALLPFFLHTNTLIWTEVVLGILVLISGFLLIQRD